jgi:Kef-type K+ transport system membrane component KefB
MDVLDFIRAHVSSLPPLAKFVVGTALIVAIPSLACRVRLPAAVGLLLSGVVVGPHGLDIFGEQRPIADFFADLGKLLLMFVAGLTMDLALFRQALHRSILFGLLTTGIPCLLGMAVGLLFGYRLIPAIAVGSLLASHTLLGSPIVARLGVHRLEPVIITVGATVLSDTLSLVIFALCVSTYKSGFSVAGLAMQLTEIAVFVPLILCGLSRMGAYMLTKVEHDEHAYVILMFGIMAVAGVLAHAINLPDIVGAFLAGLAINAAVEHKQAKEKLEFFGSAFFIPIFFAVTGFLIDPTVLPGSIVDNGALVAAMLVALMAGKGIGAAMAGSVCQYSAAARLTMWSLTLPQVATTLAATLVGFHTFNRAGQRLIDGRILDAVFALVLTTAILGPALTAHLAPHMLEAPADRDGRNARDA